MAVTATPPPIQAQQSVQTASTTRITPPVPQSNGELSAAVEEPPFNESEIIIWLRQIVLRMSLVAAVVSLITARWVERSWLCAAFCACAAAIFSGMAGMMLALWLQEQLVPKKKQV